MEKIKTYGINLNVERSEDDGQNMYSNTYLTKIRVTPISLKPYEDAKEDLDIMMARIIKRTSKSVKWKAKRSWSKRMATQSSPTTNTPSSS